MQLSIRTIEDLRTVEAATQDNGGDFGFASEIFEQPTRGMRLAKGARLLRELEELGLVDVDWNTIVNGKHICDDQFNLTEEGLAQLEAVYPSPVPTVVRPEAALAERVNAVRQDVFDVREHGDERMREVQDLLAKAQALLEQAAMGK